MKPFVEKLNPTDSSSFYAHTHRTPHFEVPWHQHVEFELILFTEGEGTSYVGNHVGQFVSGDLYFLGSNLPHTFQKAHPDMITSAVVVQFKEDFWGSQFIALPESRAIGQLLQAAARGLKLNNPTKQRMQATVSSLENKVGFERIIGLCECLHHMADAKDYQALSTLDDAQFQQRKQDRIDTIIQYTIERFKDEITLEQVADQARLSVPAFCHFFKRSTKKTYVEFLNEVRVGHACRLLSSTAKPVQEVCYESGFNTISHFHKQFTRIQQQTPSSYRRHFMT